MTPFGFRGMPARGANMGRPQPVPFEGGLPPGLSGGLPPGLGGPMPPTAAGGPPPDAGAPPGGGMPPGPPMLEAPMNPVALQRRMLIQALMQRDPSGGQRPGTMTPRPFPPMAAGERR